MDFNITTSVPAQTACDCLVIGIGADGQLGTQAAALDTAGKGYISRIIEAGDISGKKGETLLLQAAEGISARRTLLVGLGTLEERTDSQYIKNLLAAMGTLKATQCKQVVFCFDEDSVKDRDCYWRARKLVETVSYTLYNYDQTKSKKADPAKLESVSVWSTEDDDETVSLAISEGAAIANGSSLTRDLGNLPANICTPSYLAEKAQEMANEFDTLSCEILDEAQMRELGMGSLLSVSAGSEQPAKLIILKYQGADPSQKPHVLVGKGITFDTGGISLKAGAAMDEMKYDMGGAASVFGAMAAIAEMDLPLNVNMVVAAAENMPSGTATKPGDVVTSMSGQTIEVLNTDAEGRLVLCDALTYVERFEPASVVDVATLTGACIVALGDKACGLFTPDDELAEQLLDAGQYANDKAWRLPVWDEYQEQLDSNFADMANIGGKGAGSITAACFLARYTKNYRWAHLDIAGTAWKSNGKEKGSTGRCVPLLTQYLIDRTA